ncbi:family 20 glycosylhydrolase [Alteromonas sp. ASW11-36]|uniref:beta-N-acetylhexosaminidase n=1 Tax=Alteromonas arenosi TaxID=3055817 RepID=A0ABT7SU71_9ALTE|nr:family 20 glycosylhydrolase [Alteromonas sp. ASW11-36]MDM7859097.1 family 20 glycosylhydrolase [Alteromonas sp. ASW11-36]
MTALSIMAVLAKRLNSASAVVRAFSLLSVMAVTGCLSVDSKPFKQADLDLLAATLDVQYQVLSTTDKAACARVELSECFTAELTFTFPHAAPADDWVLFFSHLVPIRDVDSNVVSIEHVNGDLHKVNFINAIAAGETVKVPFIAQFWHVSRSDIVPNMYVSGAGLQPRIVKSTEAVVDENTKINYAAHAGDFNDQNRLTRGEDDQLPLATSEWLYDYYSAFASVASEPSEPRIVPNVKVAQWSGEHIVLTKGLNVRALINRGVKPALDELLQAGIVFNDDGLVVNWQVNELPNEHYGLVIDSDSIIVQASNLQSVQYALLSLAQLYDAPTQQIPVGAIDDAPEYAYRGMHIDIARNYNGKNSLFTLLDEMFLGKLNRLHLHFADDEGWRIAIQEFPELTSLGAFRCADDTQCLQPQLGAGPHRTAQVNGYLTEQDYIELLQYAQQRNIEVIPSFDTPGHARAAVQAMEQRWSASGDHTYRLVDPADKTVYSSIQYYNDNTLNPCIDSSYRFVDVVVSRLQAMHQQAGNSLKTFHLGADETAGAWVNSPACEALLGRVLTLDDVHDLLGHFVQKVYAMTQQKGLNLAGWSDGMGTIPTEQRAADMLVTVWTTLAAGGAETAHAWNESPAHSVYSFPDVLYFDFPYQNHPHEPGYYWASKNTDVFKVFQFTPQVLPVHQWLWTERKGHDFAYEHALSNSQPLGIQGQVWSEVIRSPQTLEYMLYPRLYALAERAWAKPEWSASAEQVVTSKGQGREQLLAHQQKAWVSFAQQLTRFHLPRLEARGVNFRLPPPGVKGSQGEYSFNNLYPNLVTEAYVDNAWQVVNKQQAYAADTIFRSRLPDTSVASRSVCADDCLAPKKR